MGGPRFDPAQMGLFFGIFAIFSIVMLVVTLIPYWFIYKKAGFSPWLTLLMIVPLANLIVLYVVAFSDWNVVPVESLPMEYRYGVPPPQQPPPTSLPPV